MTSLCSSFLAPPSFLSLAIPFNIFLLASWGFTLRSVWISTSNIQVLAVYPPPWPTAGAMWHQWLPPATSFCESSFTNTRPAGLHVWCSPWWAEPASQQTVGATWAIMSNGLWVTPSLVVGVAGVQSGKWVTPIFHHQCPQMCPMSSVLGDKVCTIHAILALPALFGLYHKQ